MYTFVESEGSLSLPYRSPIPFTRPSDRTQQQLAVLISMDNLYGHRRNDSWYAPGAGINAGTMLAATAITTLEAQFGLVYGFTTPPTNVSQSGMGIFQFQVTSASGTSTLYNILYTAGSNTNIVQVDVPELIPTFMQSRLSPSSHPTHLPLRPEATTRSSVLSSKPLYQLRVSPRHTRRRDSNDSLVDTLITAQGDFSLEFWNSIPLSPINAYHPVTYSASTNKPLVYYLDIDFETTSIFVGINNTVMQTSTTPPVFSSGWQHVALTYAQPYTILCNGLGSRWNRQRTSTSTKISAWL